MFKATIILIFANHWLYPIDSLPNYHSANECYHSMQHHLASLPDDLVDAGLGVYSMECEFVPLPRNHPRRS